jgi:hypothetical protein
VHAAILAGVVVLYFMTDSLVRDIRSGAFQDDLIRGAGQREEMMKQGRDPGALPFDPVIGRPLKVLGGILGLGLLGAVSAVLKRRGYPAAPPGA